MPQLTLMSTLLATSIGSTRGAASARRNQPLSPRSASHPTTNTAHHTTRCATICTAGTAFTPDWWRSHFEAAAVRLERHRHALVEALFAESIDPLRIEAERAAIAELQQAQQRLIIEQLIAERAILDVRQREQLLGLLLAQPPARTTVEDLHARPTR